MSPPDLNCAAAKRLRRAIAGLRGAKTSIGKARTWLGACSADIELNVEARAIRAIELRLLEMVRRLNDTERYAEASGVNT